MRLAVFLVAGTFTLASGDDRWVLSDPSGDRVHFRTGMVVRSIGADFTLGKLSSPSGFQRTVVRDGLGDVGIFEGGDGSVFYNDGSAGGDAYVLGPGSPSGLAEFTADARAQVQATNREELGDTVYEVTFRTEDFQSFSTFETNSASISDNDTAIGPFLELVVPIGQDFAFVFGYSYVDTEHSTGDRLAAVQSTSVNRTTYQYTYDAVGPFDPDLASYPYDSRSSFFDLQLVYDVATAAGTPGSDISGDELLDPRVIAATSSLTSVVSAVCRADLDVKLHEIPFGLERHVRIGPATLSCIGGVTLNFVDYSLESRVDWYLPGRSTPVRSVSSRDSDTPLRAGAYLGVNAHCPLAADGSVYLFGQSSYRWVDSVTARTGKASVEIDPSSWEARFGVGMVLP